MKNKLNLIFCMAILAVSSCKKNNRPDPIDPPVAPSCLLLSSALKSSSQQDLNTLTYDDKGRVIKETDGRSEITYTYLTNKIIRTDKGDRSVVITYDLDAQGRVSRSDFEGYLIDYLYNTEGYLSEIQDKDEKGKVSSLFFSYTNGNLSLIKGDILLKEGLKIEYGTEIANPNFFFFQNIGLPPAVIGVLRKYFGKPSKNLITKVTRNSMMETHSLTYEKDAKGNITKVISIATDEISSPFESTLTQEYNCK